MPGKKSIIGIKVTSHFRFNIVEWPSSGRLNRPESTKHDAIRQMAHDFLYFRTNNISIIRRILEYKLCFVQMFCILK